jgi:thiamine-phosphate pyrophosphorylase
LSDRAADSVLRLDPFYPIAPDADWVARLAGAGARFIQLRMKDASAERIAAEIAEGLKIAKAHNVQLVINDYWQEAIRLRADFLHLGQEDLAGADLAAIRAAGIRLGISTHSHEELDHALAAAPDYVALGPIFPTKLKVMPWQPQGLGRIGEWRSKIRCPLVAIGGITLERAPDVLRAGADSAAVITDILTDPEPDARTRAWIAATAPWRHLSTGLPHGN